VALWWPSRDWSQYAMFGYLLVCSTLLFFFWGTYSMSHTALGYELSDDYHVRTKVIAVRHMCFSVVASLLGGWVYWLALRPSSDMTRFYLACVYGKTGRYVEARKLWAELMEINPAFSVQRFVDSLPYADPSWLDGVVDGLRQANIPFSMPALAK